MSADRSPYGRSYFDLGFTTMSPAAADRHIEVLRNYLHHSSRILDLGCGTGIMLRRLMREPAWHAYGVDISEEGLREAGSEGARVALADSARLPFRAGTFDAIVLFDVVEHVPSPAETLQEIRRVARTGALLMVTTPNAGSPVRPLLGGRWHGLLDATHLYFFTAFTLSELVRRTGWRPIRRTTMSGAPGILRPVFEFAGVGGQLCVLARAI